jgi:hypothetical protein
LVTTCQGLQRAWQGCPLGFLVEEEKGHERTHCGCRQSPKGKAGGQLLAPLEEVTEVPSWD